MKTGRAIKVIGKLMVVMAGAIKSSQIMKDTTKVNGKMIKFAVGVVGRTLTAPILKESGFMVSVYKVGMCLLMDNKSILGSGRTNSDTA